MTTLLALTFWCTLPLIAALVHRRAGAAPDRLAAWMAVGTALGLSAVAALAYPRWPATSQPPLTDTYYVVAHFHYLATIAVFFVAAALALAVVGRGFPIVPRALSLLLFGMLYAGTGITLVPRLSRWLTNPMEAVFPLPLLIRAELAAVHLAQLAMLLLVIALPISLWNLWRKRRSA